MSPKGIRPTPWDSAVFGFSTYELQSASAPLLKAASRLQGHCTVRVSPLTPKNPLLKNGFYYADTLVTPVCDRKNFRPHRRKEADLSDISLETLLSMARHAFVHGRFHRDPNIPLQKAEARYAQWLSQLHGKHKVLGLTYAGKPAGFIGHEGGKLVLHAVAPKFRGKGLSKFLWTRACTELFRTHGRLSSSISAANLAAVSLYASLGFRFSEALDIYHHFKSGR